MASQQARAWLLTAPHRPPVSWFSDLQILQLQLPWPRLERELTSPRSPQGSCDKGEVHVVHMISKHKFSERRGRQGPLGRPTNLLTVTTSLRTVSGPGSTSANNEMDWIKVQERRSRGERSSEPKEKTVKLMECEGLFCSQGDESPEDIGQQGPGTMQQSEPGGDGEAYLTREVETWREEWWTSEALSKTHTPATNH
ncbi:hypothetical protein NDU88_004605 [Pleurodeles waltl]|uniref:Uncharacterized protein n=1 Tax=Pleurodeles waltl TaxID=8319 RepID=A0AAV7QGM7_PLEWA|nr:hypothetical protein NDU88_004605 [Pleurodeles waltl]